jgi:hypothetical protein
MVMEVIQMLHAENATGPASKIETSHQGVEAELKLFVGCAPYYSIHE